MTPKEIVEKVQNDDQFNSIKGQRIHLATLLLESVIEMVEKDRVILREPNDHLPNVYRHLNAKNELRDEIISSLQSELKAIKELK